MATVEDHVDVIEAAAKNAGISDDDLLKACQHIASKKSNASGGKSYLDALREHVDDQEDPRDKLKRKMESGNF